MVRAIAIHTGYLPGKVATATYFIDADSDLPVVSLSTNPAYLFDPEIGIYHDNNIWNDWERPIHVEFYDTDDTIGFAIDAGVKIYGGWTRTLPQKSLAIFAREDYGYNEIDYQIFPDLPFTTYESFVLRNSGNDWMNTMFRDGLMTGLVAEDGIDIPAFRPSVVYINGEYWGIYNIREKISDRYIEQHHNVSHDSLDLLEMSGWPIDGDAAHYDNMIAFIQNNSLSVPANYEYVKTQMDIENFITYEVAQIFICNTDWPGNNIKFWRPKTLGGKWRWIMYDTDFGFGLVYDYTHNTLAFATEPNGPDWPNPPWSTFLLRSLLTNYNFRVDFINRYADLLNSSFRVDRMIEQINQKKAAIINEMPEQINRWGGNMWDWLTNIQVLRNFAYERKNYAQSHVIQYFGLPEYSQVDLNVEPASAGRINISTLTLSDFPWSGEYFNGVPVKIKAIPDPGFKFIGWQGNIVSDSADITVIFSNYTELTAVFEAYIPDTIVINEINYHSAPDFNPEDWVEFYNPDDSLVDLTGWVFKDEDDAHSFPFPSGTVIEPYGYLVLCFDTTAFDSLFPEVINNLGNMGFGLSGNGELIRLYDPSGLLIDTVHYNDSLPWPVEPDGNGPTLELIDPSLDNALPESWMASGQHGTPGSENGVYVSVPFDRQTDELDCRINPNPFRGTTTFLFTSNTEQVIRIEIFNLYGERVMTIPHIMLPKGSYYFNWSGNDQNGNVLKPGLYVCKISTEKRAFGRKLIKVE